MNISYQDVLQTEDPEKAIKVYFELMKRNDPNSALRLEQAWGLDGMAPQRVSEELARLADERTRSDG